MNRIYYQGSFKLATDWPNVECYPSCGYCDIPCDRQREAIASAMENGVEFADQEKVKLYVLKHWKDRQRINFQYGDNWDCPENVEIKEKCQHNGIHNSTCIYSKVAILKSESVEKKEKVMGGEWYVCHDPRSGRSYVTNIRNLSDSELQSIADRLNQSTTKE